MDIGSNYRWQSPTFLKESRECWPFTRDFDAKENTEKTTNDEPDLDVEEIPEESFKCHKTEEIKHSMSMEDLQEVLENKSKVGTIKSSKSEVVVHKSMISEVSKHLEVGSDASLKGFGSNIDTSKNVIKELRKMQEVVVKHLITEFVKEERVKQDLVVKHLISEFVQGGLADVPHVELPDSRPLAKSFSAFIAVEFDPGGLVTPLSQLVVPFMLLMLIDLNFFEEAGRESIEDEDNSGESNEDDISCG